MWTFRRAVECFHLYRGDHFSLSLSTTTTYRTNNIHKIPMMDNNNNNNNNMNPIMKPTSYKIREKYFEEKDLIDIRMNNELDHKLIRIYRNETKDDTNNNEDDDDMYEYKSHRQETKQVRCVWCCSVTKHHEDVEGNSKNKTNKTHSRLGYKTTYQCTICNVALCAKSRYNNGQSCFDLFHTSHILNKPCTTEQDALLCVNNKSHNHQKASSNNNNEVVEEEEEYHKLARSIIEPIFIKSNNKKRKVILNNNDIIITTTTTTTKKDDNHNNNSSSIILSSNNQPIYYKKRDRYFYEKDLIDIRMNQDLDHQITKIYRNDTIHDDENENDIIDIDNNENDSIDINDENGIDDTNNKDKSTTSNNKEVKQVRCVWCCATKHHHEITNNNDENNKKKKHTRMGYKTTRKCNICNVPLCIKPRYNGQSCFDLFHSSTVLNTPCTVEQSALVCYQSHSNRKPPPIRRRCCRRSNT